MLTPELESAAVVVRVSTLTVPQREHVGVVLRAAAVSTAVTAESTRRFAAVLLPGFDAVELQDKACVIKVLRQKFDANGSPYVLLQQGTLVHFNAQTHAAVVQFTEDFPYRLEPGVAAGTVADVAAGTDGVGLLVASYDPQQPQSGGATPLVRGRMGTALPGKIAVTVRAGQLKEGRLLLSEAKAEVPRSGAAGPVLLSDGRLAGFAGMSTAGGEWRFEGFAVPPVAEVAGLYCIPQSVHFSTTTLGAYNEVAFNVGVEAVLEDPKQEVKEYVVAVQTVPSAEVAMVKNPQNNQPAIPQSEEVIHCKPGAGGMLLFTMNLPREQGSTYRLVQVQLAQQGGQVVFHAAPFLVEMTTREGRLELRAKGVAGQEDVPRLPSPEELAAAKAVAAGMQPEMAARIFKQKRPSVFVPPPQPQPGAIAGAGRPMPGQGGMRGPGGMQGPGGMRGPGGMQGPGAIDPRAPVAAGAAPGGEIKLSPAVREMMARRREEQANELREPEAAAAVAESGRVELTTESRILYGAALCEGREVLFKLEGAPHWKRLSLASGKWLPLPAEDLSGCHLAGNKEALFVLDPAQGEIRRYNAGTLALEKTGRLPEGRVYRGLAAGCLSDDAPLAVISDDGVLACDPEELTAGKYAALKVKETLQLKDQFYYLATGDGSVVYARPYGRWTDTNLPCFEYRGVLSGYVTENVYESQQVLPTVGGLCTWDGSKGVHHPGMTAKAGFQMPPNSGRGPLANSPNYFVVTQGMGRPMRGAGMVGGTGLLMCSFYSYYSLVPWATVAVPEAGGVPVAEWRSFAERVWLDAEALTLAVWHEGQKITLHTVDRANLPAPVTPVLLNYPDCHVQRGGSFRFTPQMLGAGVQVATAQAPEGCTTAADGTLNWQVPLVGQTPMVGFEMRLAGAGTAAGADTGANAGALPPTKCTFDVILHLGGMQPVLAVAVPPKAEAPSGRRVREPSAAEQKKSMEEALASAVRSHTALPLNSRYYISESAIDRVVPGLTDYLALRMQDKSLALFSVRDWKVMGSHAIADTDQVFLAGDAVLLYSTITRLLTRHALPDFKVTHRFQTPGQARLAALGVGNQPTGPVTLLLEKGGTPQVNAVGQPISPGDGVLILDKQTLTPTKWAPYTPVADPYWLVGITSTLQNLALPVQLRTSNDGRLVQMHQEQKKLVISPGLTTGFDRQAIISDSAQPEFDGVLTAGSSLLWANRSSRKYGDEHGRFPSSCGNFFSCPRSEAGMTGIRLYSADDGRPLLDLACVELFDFNDRADVVGVSRQRQVQALGEKNLLTILSRGGNVLQVAHLDVSVACRAVAPLAAYVTSHPFPVVMEGRTLDYQLTLSNPTALSSCDLVEKIPGATMSSQGHFTYRAPNGLLKSQQVNVSVQIRLRNGEVAQHKFPIYVLALGGKKK